MIESDKYLRRVLSEARVIACVGASPNPARPSHYVSQFLVSRGYRVIPVNPGQAGRELFGETAVASLADIQEQVDLVDIFRRSDQIPPVVDAALNDLPGLRSIWMQKGISNEPAADKARANGLSVVQNRCPMIEIPRLFGDAHRDSFGVVA